MTDRDNKGLKLCICECLGKNNLANHLVQLFCAYKNSSSMLKKEQWCAIAATIQAYSSSQDF